MYLKSQNRTIRDYALPKADQTALKKAEEILRKNEIQERLQQTLDNILEGCQIISFDFRYLYVNKAATRQSRKTKEELLNHTMMAVYPGIERTKMFTYLQRCMKNRQLYRLENEFKFPDGSTGCFELKMEPVPEGVIIFSEDISQRKVAENSISIRNKKLEELTTSQENTKTALLNVMEDLNKAKEETELEKAKDEAILSSIGDGLIVTDQNGMITSINHVAKKLLGTTGNEVGCELTHITSLQDENGRVLRDGQRPLRKCLSSGKIVTATCWYTRSDATKFPAAIIVSPISISSKLIGAVEIFRDITQEKNRVELLERQARDLKKFEMAVADSSDQIVISDVEGKVLYANHATEEITGYPIKEILGTKAGSLWGVHMDKNYYQKLWKTMKVDRKTFMAQIDNKRKSGERYTSEIHISPVIDNRGEAVYFVAIERDITREKEVDRAKSEFVSVASHQLRTPLGIAKWYLEAIKEENYFKGGPKTTRDYIDEIYKSNERLISLVRDLLSVSRIDQGQIKDSPTNTDVTRLIKDVIREVSIVASNKNIKFNQVIKINKALVVFIDPMRLHEVIENLVSNAIEYTPEGGTVKVIVGKSDGQLMISVKDTGIGISEKDKKKLFTKFFRSEQGVASYTNGSGLGLYVVKSYVEGWGGKVSVESKKDKGSTFTVTLPISLKGESKGADKK